MAQPMMHSRMADAGTCFFQVICMHVLTACSSQMHVNARSFLQHAKR